MNETPRDAPAPGEAARPSRGAHLVGLLDPQESIEASVRVRPRAALDAAAIEAQANLPPAERHYPSREDFATAHGADPADLAKVEAFARQHGLTVVDSSPERRSVTLSGRCAAFTAAFGVGLSRFETDRGTFHAPTGSIAIPPELSQVIEAVVGLDNQPHVEPRDADAGQSG